MTVSRVLQGRRELVNVGTYARVLAAMRELDYVPVRTAMQNRHVETNAIGLVPYYRSPTGHSIDSLTFEGLCEQASLSHYDLYIMLRGESEWMANREDLRFLDRRSDGFIFVSPGVGEWEAGLESLVQNQIPAVVCYRREVPEGVAWVDPDNEAIARLAVKHLTKNGHSRIAFLTGPGPSLLGTERLADLSGARPNFDDRERVRHFSAAMRDMGCAEWSEQIFSLQDHNWRLSAAEVRQIIASGATAVICGDLVALQLWELAAALGKRIPEDLSIVSIDGQMQASHRGLTSVSFGYDEIGRQAVKAWISLAGGHDAGSSCKVVAVELVERESVCPPRRAAKVRKS